MIWSRWSLTAFNVLLILASFHFLRFSHLPFCWGCFLLSCKDASEKPRKDFWASLESQTCLTFAVPPFLHLYGKHHRIKARWKGALFQTWKRALCKMNVTQLFLPDIISQWRLLPKSQACNYYKKGFFDLCVLVILISIWLSPTVIATSEAKPTLMEYNNHLYLSHTQTLNSALDTLQSWTQQRHRRPGVGLRLKDSTESPRWLAMVLTTGTWRWLPQNQCFVPTVTCMWKLTAPSSLS